MNHKDVERHIKWLVENIKTLKVDIVYTDFIIDKAGELIYTPDITVVVNGMPYDLTIREKLNIENYAKKNNLTRIAIESEECIFEYDTGYTDAVETLYIDLEEKIEKRDREVGAYINLLYKNGEIKAGITFE